MASLMTSRLRTLILTALVATHVILPLASVAVLWWGNIPAVVEDDFLGWYTAVLLAQASLLALGNGWGRRPTVSRLLWSTVVVWVAGGVLLEAVPRYYLTRRTVTLLWILYGLHWLLVHAALGIARAWRGWSLTGVPSPPGTAPARLLEFSRRRAVVWIVLLTALFAGGRWLVEYSGGPTPQLPREAGLPILLGGNLLIVALAIWAAFVQDSGLLWLALASLLAMVLTAGEVVVFHLGRVPVLLSEVFVWSLNGWQFVILLGSLLVLRSCGYRLPPQSERDTRGAA